MKIVAKKEDKKTFDGTFSSPTWSSSGSSLIFFTSHLLATTMSGCRERDSVTLITVS